ncbi:unnamed protein product [Kuraishia capsulata CBS 1993]|uniref:ZZ-type domain-containing protein n=1 Tax=Kuraishia capsulata CBS 1993 TaxID=1382522 RepID=W6MRM6_9ASCO|nr:uncharacterized protein KUCA_T00004984001 [Kuraishia capsulata CBS 1993]CDK28998.1 unnamed protein product [Kuraishia capsulata CBS 1993]
MSFTVVTVKITTDDVHKDEYIFYGENLPTPLTEQALLKSLIRNSPEKYRDSLKNCELEIKRKSKKSKRYVLLKTAEDFAALNRSLQVKNCLKLDIVCGKRKEEVSKDVGAAAEFAGVAPSIPPSTAETSASSSTSSAQPTDEPSPGKAKDLPSLIKIFEDLVDDESSSKKFFDHYSKLYEKKGHPSIPEFLASLVNINDLGTIISDNLLNSDFIKNLAKLFEEQFASAKPELGELYSVNGIFVDSENESAPVQFRCSKSPKNSKVEKITSPPWPAPAEIHRGFYCDGCVTPGFENGNYIHGVRYHCLECKDFDLCEKCENDGVAQGSHNDTHLMVKIKKNLHKCELNAMYMARLEDDGYKTSRAPKKGGPYKNNAFTFDWDFEQAKSGMRSSSADRKDFDLAAATDMFADLYLENNIGLAQDLVDLGSNDGAGLKSLRAKAAKYDAIQAEAKETSSVSEEDEKAQDTQLEIPAVREDIKEAEADADVDADVDVDADAEANEKSIDLQPSSELTGDSRTTLKEVTDAAEETTDSIAVSAAEPVTETEAEVDELSSFDGDNGAEEYCELTMSDTEDYELLSERDVEDM